MQRVGLNISNDTTASTVEKDAENHSYFVIDIVTEHISCSQNACFSGISKFCDDWLFFVVSEYLRHYESVLT